MISNLFLFILFRLDNTHTATVEQWDWELRIHKEQKNLQFLKDTGMLDGREKGEGNGERRSQKSS